MKSGGEPQIGSRYGHRSASFALIRDVKNNDPEAWQRLVRLYTPLICYWCRQSGIPANDVPDLAQDVFRSLANAIRTFRYDRDGDSFRGWLRTITRNKVRDFLRKEKRTLTATGGCDNQRRIASIPSTSIESKNYSKSGDHLPSLTEAIELVRCEFEERTWRAFWRTAIDGQTSSAVASELGVSPAAVRKAKSRVLNRLRSELDNP